MVKPKKEIHSKQSVRESTIIFTLIFVAVTLITDLFVFDAALNTYTFLKAVILGVLVAIPWYFGIKSWNRLIKKKDKEV